MTAKEQKFLASFFQKRSSSLIFFCVALAGGGAIGTTDLAYAFINSPPWLLWCDAAGSFMLSAIIVAGARTARVPSLAGGWIVPGTLAAVLATQFLATAWWPNSGDEYGYRFLAETLLHGRLYNPPAPVPLLFDFNWIFTLQGKRFSQYAPGFPALLAPFLALGIPFLLNPLLACGLAWLQADTLRALRVPPHAAWLLSALLAFSPFILFNGAALYPHILTAVAVLGIIRLQLAADVTPAPRYPLAIGALFSLLLLSRYEVFAIMAALYVPARFLAGYRHIARDAKWLALGGLPLAVCFLAYNTAITGRPLRTPLAWASPGTGFGFQAVGDQGVNTPWLALARTLQWGGELALYTSAALVLLWAAALFAKARAGRARYYDLIFPVAVVFFFLFANIGGHRFGPRYWLFAWPPAMLTIATGIPPEGAWLRLHRLRLHLPTLAALHLAMYCGFVLITAHNNSAYVAMRREVYKVQPPRTPALVLIPNRIFTLSRFQTAPTWAGSDDFARNDLDFTAPVLYGRAEAFARACSLRGRFVYFWRAPGVLDAVSCRR